MRLDVEKFVAGLHDYLARAFAPLLERIKSLEARELLKGDPGVNGKDGSNGINGKDGRDGVDGKDGTPGLKGQDGEQGQPGADGKDGLPGRDGKDGADGKDGSDGRNGIDGKSVTVDEVMPLLEAHFAKWALDFERRASDVLQRSIDRIPAPKDGRDGKNGADGKDGLGFDDMQVTQNERAVTLALVRGEQRKEFSLQFPVMIYRGVFKEGSGYKAGDAATFGGSLWVARADTADKPGTSDAWTLAAKRGRDYREPAKL